MVVRLITSRPPIIHMCLLPSRYTYVCQTCINACIYVHTTDCPVDDATYNKKIWSVTDFVYGDNKNG